MRRRFAIVLLVLLGAAMLAPSAWAATLSLRQGLVAFTHEDYVRAARIFLPLAAAGDATAQAHLGLLYETGRGVPLNDTQAAHWYRRAAEQGHAGAQLSLGLLYDRGQGVRRDLVEAGAWLTIAAAAAPKRSRAVQERLRDALTTKMTRGEVAQARLRALQWTPTRERF